MSQSFINQNQLVLSDRKDQPTYFCTKLKALVGATILVGFLSLGTSQNSEASTSSGWTTASKSWSNDSSVISSRSTHVNESSSDTSPFSPGSHNIAIDVGQVFLMGDLTKYADNIGAQAHYTYGVSDLFGFDTSFGYSEHSNGNFSMTSLLLGMRMNMTWYDKIVPYAVFGLGFYKPNYKGIPTGANGSTPQLDSSTSLSAILFGIHLGPGIDLELSKNFFFGASLTFHNMFTATKALSNGTNTTLGGTFTSFFLHTGVTF